MNTKNIVIGAVSLVVLFLILFGAYKLTNTPVVTDFSAINKIRTQDHTKWKAGSKNILVEYSDLQCPACRGAYNFFKDMEKTATPNATFVFRHLPLYQIHPHAFQAAYAAEAASNQGKFWEMESALYENQPDWADLSDPVPYFVKLAGSFKLDINKFKADMASEAVKNRVQSDLTEADTNGFNSTPTYILNGKKVEGINSFDDFKKLLQSL